MRGAAQGYLLLEDGTVFRGRSVAAEGAAFGEAVFTTGMTGYQETVTDPSYAEQLVCFTAPMVGNYGVDERRLESSSPHARAVLMRRLGGEDWALWLAERGIVALDEVDTRSLTLRVREAGAMRAVAVADERTFPVADALEQVRAQPTMEGAALVAHVSTSEPYVAEPEGRVRVAVVDYGVKRSILRGSRSPVPPSRSSRTSAIPTSSRATTVCSSRTGPATPRRSSRRPRSCARRSAACRCSGSASATS